MLFLLAVSLVFLCCSLDGGNADGGNIKPYFNVAELGSRNNKKSAENYLLKYGYLADYSDYSPTKGLKPDQLKNKLLVFQEFANLNQTGRLDQATMKQMEKERCGMADLVIKRRWKRWEHQGTRWNKNRLTWNYDEKSETRDLPRETVLRIFRKAFSLWSRRTNMDFVEISGNDPDIWIKFKSNSHGDPYPFDGEGGTLAHAFYPGQNRGIDGDVHFDDAETYTNESPKGRNLLWVATHEIGHSLGIAHSRKEGAVMYPWYTPYKAGFDLDFDDIMAIQYLYGGRRIPDPSPTTKPMTTTTTTKATTSKPCLDKRGSVCQYWATTGFCERGFHVEFMWENCCISCTEKLRGTKARTKKPTTTTTTTTTTSTTSTTTTRRRPRPRPRPRQNLKSCPTDQISAMWYLPRFKYFAVSTSSNNFYMVNTRGRIMYNVKNLSRFLKRSGFTKSVSAALTANINGNDDKFEILFSGKQYSVYKGLTRFVSGPHSIHDGSGPLNLRLPSWVNEVTAAMQWHRNKKIYLFFSRGNTGYYSRYNLENKRFDTGYPKTVRRGFGGGVPVKGVDAALSSDLTGNTYFLSGSMLYRLNDRTASLMTGYPTQIGKEIIQCQRPGALRTDGRLTSFIARLFQRIKQSGNNKADERHVAAEENE